MKLIFSLALIFLVWCAAYSQPIFQGSIVYTLHAPQEKTDAELTILFAPNKIKVKFKEKEDYDKTYLLIDLDSAKFYTVNAESKSFQLKKLTELVAEILPSPKVIAGYTSNPVNVTGSGVSGLVGFSGNTILFTAPDLYFPISKKYAGTPQLMMINNNHIVLGAEISLALPGMTGNEMPDSIKAQMKVTVEAKKVSAQTFDVAEFSIPNDFNEQAGFSSATIESTDLDSVAVAPDTAMIVTPPKMNKQQNSRPSTPKKTTPVKTEAIKPKNMQTKA